jgi:ornithine decarboxylase
MTHTAFASVEELVRGKTTDAPVFCVHPQAVRATARGFIERFPGEVLYAVKANPDPNFVRWMVEAGIKAFDTASVREIALCRGVLADAHCSFNHPVKPRAAIVAAYRDWGIRDFVVDHIAELDKLIEEVGTDLIVQVRVASPNPSATISFNAKFGATPADASALLRAVHERGARAAISTHVGYQTLDPVAFARGLQLLSAVLSDAGVHAEYVNLGGGFPSVLMPAGKRLEDFLATIAQVYRDDARLAPIPLRCEPGSALAHPGGGVLTQVLLVKSDGIYINDGVYGAMSELLHTRIQPPTRVLTPAGEARGGALRPFTVFGPTCDSYDTIPAAFELPGTIREGDWLYLGMMGAYSHILITDFNGVGDHEYAVIDDAPGAHPAP